MGRKGIVDDTFELIVIGTPYIVVYEIMESSVEVIGVFHAARDRR